MAVTHTESPRHERHAASVGVRSSARPPVAPLRAMASSQRLGWLFRIALAMEFIGHGAFGIIGKEAWVPYFTIFGFSEANAWDLMPVVGTIDIALGLVCLVRPMRATLLYMSVWGLMTALLRPATGEGWWEMLERGGNYAVPFAYLVMVGLGGRSIRSWLAPVPGTAFDGQTAARMAWVLRIGTAILLIGHGGFGAAMQKGAWTGYFAEAGIRAETVEALGLVTAVGLFEIALGLLVAVRPAQLLLAFVLVWKVGTELLRPLAGEPLWEFIERGGSYAAPLALMVLVGWTRSRSSSEPGTGSRLVQAS